jgi:hypothetical protein
LFSLSAVVNCAILQNQRQIAPNNISISHIILKKRFACVFFVCCRHIPWEGSGDKNSVGTPAERWEETLPHYQQWLPFHVSSSRFHFYFPFFCTLV